MESKKVRDGAPGGDAESTGAVDNLPTANYLISAFRETDRNLSDAVEEDDMQLIRQLGAEADRLIEEMINCDCESKKEQELLLKFLIERFVLEQDDEASLKKRICDRLLSEILA
ncbi:MAG: hypothetical protein AAF478_13925 [Pseudomonadota bacterium]